MFRKASTVILRLTGRQNEMVFPTPSLRLGGLAMQKWFSKQNQFNKSIMDPVEPPAAPASKPVLAQGQEVIPEKPVEGLQVGKQEKKQKKEKPKKEVEKKQPEEEDLGPRLFSLLDIRIGEIVECWKHPESENLYCEKIQVCGQLREIASGLQKFVEIDKMKGSVLVMVNLKPRPLAGFLSNGMVVCASTVDHTQVELLIPEGANGERVYLEGFEEIFTQGAILPVLNPKKKVVERCLEFFKTNEDGLVTWKGIPLRTKAGLLRASIKNGNVG